MGDYQRYRDDHPYPSNRHRNQWLTQAELDRLVQRFNESRCSYCIATEFKCTERTVTKYRDLWRKGIQLRAGVRKRVISAPVKKAVKEPVHIVHAPPKPSRFYSSNFEPA